MPGRSVLLVDDDPEALETLSPYFRLAGFDVSTADNGRGAVHLAKNHAFEAIVSDLRMPDISGIQVLKDLRGAGVNAPFIMISGYGTVESTAQAMKLGAADFLQKPVDGVCVVRSVIEAELGRSSLEDAPLARPDEQTGPFFCAISRAVARLPVDHGPLSDGTRATLLATLARGVARPDLSIWQFLAGAEALRRVATAGDDAAGSELVGALLEPMMRGERPRREPRHGKVKEAIALLLTGDRSTLALSARRVGRAIGISATHLGRLIRQYVGLDFRGLRRVCRMKPAIRLLTETAEHVGQIALSCGYESVSHFDHDFRTMFGMCPRAFRRLYQAAEKVTPRGSTF